MRTAATVSLVVHVAVLVLMFAVGTGAPRIIPGPDVVQVALIAPQELSAPPPPPQPKPPPEPEATPLKPTDEAGVKLAPPPPRKKPAEKPKAKEREPSPTSTVLPAAPAGPTGLSGEVAVDAGNFEFTYYLLLVRNRVTENWSPPGGLLTRGEPVRAVVYFRIDRGGELTAARLETASGQEFFDRSVLRAVQLSTPMPPLPLGFAGSELGVHFVFEYAAP
ncbi:MAG TPA: energy transducer TonB [Candidatus Eisenbacteria bacterium]|jgi:TonB family protein